MFGLKNSFTNFKGKTKIEFQRKEDRLQTKGEEKPCANEMIKKNGNDLHSLNKSENYGSDKKSAKSKTRKYALYQ